MTRFIKMALVFMAALFMFGGCTENQRAKDWGGNYTVALPKGQKLVVATWKESDLWYLLRPMKKGEQPETMELIEDSSWGVMSGKVTFVESR